MLKPLISRVYRFYNFWAADAESADAGLCFYGWLRFWDGKFLNASAPKHGRSHCWRCNRKLWRNKSGLDWSFPATTFGCYGIHTTHIGKEC